VTLDFDQIAQHIRMSSQVSKGKLIIVSLSLLLLSLLLLHILGNISINCCEL
jgi:hypothetical protein